MSGALDEFMAKKMAVQTIEQLTAISRARQAEEIDFDELNRRSGELAAAVQDSVRCMSGDQVVAISRYLRGGLMSRFVCCKNWPEMEEAIYLQAGLLNWACCVGNILLVIEIGAQSVEALLDQAIPMNRSANNSPGEHLAMTLNARRIVQTIRDIVQQEQLNEPDLVSWCDQQAMRLAQL